MQSGCELPVPVCPHGQSPYQHFGFQRVGLKHNLDLKGWNSQVHREFPVKFDSSNASSDYVSREIGRKVILIMLDYAIFHYIRLYDIIYIYIYNIHTSLQCTGTADIHAVSDTHGDWA